MEQHPPLPQRIAAVARSVDGLGVGLYSLVAAVLPEASSGASAWKDAVNRNDRLPEADRQAIPATYLGKIEGNRQQTHVVLLEFVPSVISFVLKEPMEFFNDTEAHEALVQLAGREATELAANTLAAAAIVRAEEQACLLPALISQSRTPAQFRISKRAAGGILGSVRDFVGWLGLDRNHTWNDWLQGAFKTQMSEHLDIDTQTENFAVLEYVVLPGESCPTPMTNYTGFCLILRLCAGRSAISDAMIDEATATLGRVKVGDSRLHAEIDQNAAAASAEDRAFVLGPNVAASSSRQSLSTTTVVLSRQTRSSHSVIETTSYHQKKALTEPFLDWIKDLGAKRAEVPAAKASLRLIIEIEMTAGALPKDTAAAKASASPPVQFRSFAEAALASVRDAVERRLSPIVLGSTKRPRSQQDHESSSASENAVDADIDDPNILKVSEVMNAAEVWQPV